MTELLCGKISSREMRRAATCLAWAVCFAAIAVSGCWAFAEQSSPAQEESSHHKELSVRDFGAAGDGIRDDTDAVQSAVDRGGAILFPAGRYRLTRTVNVDLAQTGWVSLSGRGVARIIMEGPGPAFRFVGTHTGTADPNSVKPDVWEQQRMPLVDGLEIVGNHEEACGLEAVRTMQWTVTRTTIRSTLHALRLFERNRNVVLSDCHFYDNRGCGVLLEDVDLHQINVIGCHISYNRGGGVVVRGGYLRNLQISGCDIEFNMGADSPPTANVLIDSVQSIIGHAEIAIVGCTIQHSVRAPDSANIRFIGRDSTGRYWGNLTIADNVLSDVTRNIEIIAARGVSITGNTFWGAAEEDLFVVDSENVLVGPNVFDQNPNYNREGNYRGGVGMHRSRGCTLQGLHLADILGPAITLEECDGVNVTGCTVRGSRGPGVQLLDVRRGRVSDCLLEIGVSRSADGTAPPALRVQGGSHLMIRGNMTDGETEVSPDSSEVSLADNVRIPPREAGR
ncbi:MAG: right-handed parallel beta-helix repeat-containing protein [Thermogutta sp.]